MQYNHQKNTFNYLNPLSHIQGIDHVYLQMKTKKEPYIFLYSWTNVWRLQGPVTEGLPVHINFASW